MHLPSLPRLLLASAGVALLAALAPSPATAAVPIAETGMKSFADWNPDNTGTVVVSDLLQEAINWCQTHQRTLYIPPGTYLVDRTIELRCNSSNTNNGQFPYIHGDAYNRPVIRLKDGTFTGSPSPQNASPVFRLRHVDPSRNASWVYFAVISNLNFDLGNNPGACALDFPSAQDSHLFNLSIYGQSFTVGLSSLPGSNSANINLEVIGGRFGIRVGETVGINLTGVRLIGQSEAALRIDNWDGTTIVGLESVGPGPAIIVANGTNARQGRIFLLDSRIEVSDPTRPAIQLGNRTLVLRNTYVKGTDQIVVGATHSLAVAAGGQWTHVRTYADAPSPFNDMVAFNHLDGVKLPNHRLADFGYTSTAPANLRTRHLPHEIFAFNHPEAVNALSFPGDTPRQKIQAALDGPDRVIYLPAGSHPLEAPLHLPLGKVLLGDPGKRTFLAPTYVPAEETHVLNTPDAEGFVAIQDLFISTRDLDFDGGIHWRTSDGFILNVRNYLGFANHERNVRAWLFTGHAGGRVYSLQDHRNILPGIVPASAEHRKVLVRGTSRPLTFYGLNVERGGEKRNIVQPHPFVELLDAQNVRILGTKTEPDTGPAFRFTNSRNAVITGLCTHRITGAPYLVLAPGDGATTNIEAIHVGTRANSSTSLLIAPFADIRENELVVLFRQGSFDSAVFEPAPVNEPARVTLVAPVDGASFSAFPTPVIATVHDPHGEIALVEFFVNGTFWSDAAQAPYSTTWLPTAAGPYTLTAEATTLDLATLSAEPVRVTVLNRVPSILTQTLPSGTVGQPYSVQLLATEGDGPLTWSLDSGVIPAGLELSSTGALAGTPTTAGTTLFDVRVADADLITGPADEDVRTLSLTILTPRRGSPPLSAQPIRPIVPPPAPVTLVFAPTDDAFLQNNDRFNDAFLRVEHSATRVRRSYLRFSVTGVTGTVQSAVLKLRGTDTGTRTGTYKFYRGTDTAWTETTLTPANAPAILGEPLHTQVNVAPGALLEIDVTSAISGNGTVTFILQMDLNAGQDVRFSSKEGTEAPVLQVTHY
jgi:hypothetical protein